MSGRLKALRPWLPLLAGVLIVLGEHVWRAEPVRPFLSGAAGVLLAVALIWNLALSRRAARQAGEPEAAPEAGGAAGGGTGALAAPTALFVFSALTYAAWLWVPEEGTALDWPALLGWAWPLSLVAGGLLYVFVEIAWASQAGAPRPEGRRLRLARDAGHSLALLLLLVIALNFVFDRLDWQWDLGYFHAALPSEATRETLRTLDAPLEVAVFFPQGNPVRSLVEDYLAGLEGLSPQLQIHYYDADLDPDAARSHKARKNGILQVSRDGVQRELFLGLTIDAAGSRLMRLDSDFLAKVAEVTRPKRTVYLTVGHGERNESGNDLPTGSRVRGLEAILRAQNFTVKKLGFADGLGTEIPRDAAMVVVVGPQFPFRPEEEAALRRYFDGGGRLLLFLEPDAGTTPGVALPARREGPPLEKLLAHYGVDFVPVVQANDRIYGRRTQTKADYALLATNRYQSHPSVAELHRNPNQFPLLFLGTGAFTKGAVPDDLIVRETIKAMPGTWGDANGNFAFDEKTEKRDEPTFAVAVAQKNPPRPRKKDAKAPQADAKPEPAPAEPRMLAFADADMASDLFIQNRANQLALLDGIAWVAGDTSPAAAPKEEEDLKIQHLKGDELIWFYLPVFGVPALVLLVGFWIGRRTGAFSWRGANG